MNNGHRWLLAATLLAVATGCGKSENKDVAAKGTAAEAKPASPRRAKRLEALGLTIDVPPDAVVKDASEDGPAVTVGSSAFRVKVSAVTDDFPATLERATARVERDLACDFKSWLKKEPTATGWELRYTCTGEIDETVKTGIVVRAKIGEKSYECEALTAGEGAMGDVALACTSLRGA
jgi:hypothetical protein